MTAPARPAVRGTLPRRFDPASAPAYPLLTAVRGREAYRSLSLTVCSREVRMRKTLLLAALVMVPLFALASQRVMVNEEFTRVAG